MIRHKKHTHCLGDKCQCKDLDKTSSVKYTKVICTNKPDCVCEDHTFFPNDTLTFSPIGKDHVGKCTYCNNNHDLQESCLAYINKTIPNKNILFSPNKEFDVDLYRKEAINVLNNVNVNKSSTCLAKELVTVCDELILKNALLNSINKLLKPNFIRPVEQENTLKKSITNNKLTHASSETVTFVSPLNKNYPNELEEKTKTSCEYCGGECPSKFPLAWELFNNELWSYPMESIHHAADLEIMENIINNNVIKSPIICNEGPFCNNLAVCTYRKNQNLKNNFCCDDCCDHNTSIPKCLPLEK